MGESEHHTSFPVCSPTRCNHQCALALLLVILAVKLLTVTLLPPLGPDLSLCRAKVHSLEKGKWVILDDSWDKLNAFVTDALVTDAHWQVTVSLSQDGPLFCP